ncbi:MAG: hypothetical protein JJE10_02435 [Thermoleophilia bacterium]|nr:hypothetical protein [Thermoleophilia bacterium]
MITGEDCTKADIPVLGTCEVPVRYAPFSAGNRAATLEIRYDGSASPLTVPLSAAGKAKIKKVSVNGPKKVKKGQKATYKVKFSNSGNATATGVRLKVAGRGVSLNTSVGRISAGKTRNVKVNLKPRTPGKGKIKFKVTTKNASGKTVKKKITVKK